ncbi:MAG TPA: hypothetical protein VK809_02845 [Bacteroidia bacterium]|jgi:hypothetical protein|nr:hypothetical protein [Bacteroidia bacterium]
MRKVKLYRGTLLVVFALLIFSNHSAAQNYKEDMLKIRTSFKSNCHSFSIKYLYFPYDSVKKATDSITGTCIVDSNNWYYKISTTAGLIEYLKNDRYYLSVNHANKTILINKSSLAKRDLWDIKKVDSLLSIPTVKISYADKGSKGEYDVSFEGGSWNRMILVFSKTQYTLNEIWLYSIAKGKIYGESYNKPVIGIIYNSYNTVPKSKDDFNEGKYVQRNKNGNFEGVGAFREFKLVDYLNKRT